MPKKTTAFGKPGIEATWTSSQKSGVGSAVEMNSRIWFTLSHGIVNEVYFPTVDMPNTRDMQLVVTDGKNFYSEEKRHCTSYTKTLKLGTPAYEITNTCNKKQYQIKKLIFANPYNSTLIQQIQFIPLVKKKFHLYVVLEPHMHALGSSNKGYIKNYKGLDLLTATRDKKYYLTLCSNHPFLKLSCGFAGKSDGYSELKKHKYLKNTYQRAIDGNIALTGEIDLEKGNEFTLFLSFGHSFEEAAKTSKATFFHNQKHLLKKYISGWERVYQKAPKINYINEAVKNLYYSSIMVLTVHLGKVAPGNVIASLSIPWGTDKTDKDLGGYHLIWPRDLVEISGGFIAANNEEEARLILHFLASIQEEDGHFAQCLWHTGKPYWENVQMDETALPVILAGILKEKQALKWLDPWPLVYKAIRYLIKNGPVTPQDRWEEDGGYTAFTLATEITALLIGADFFEEKGLKKEAKYIRQVADYWNSNIENWTYATNTKLSKKLKIEGYYVRITPDDLNPNRINETIEVKNRPPDHTFNPASEIISCDSLALVRFGLRDPKDPKILNTLKAIDHLLKRETKTGPTWKRYNEDGYGEHENGDSFNGTGIGRGWPLLTAERAHYELAAGNIQEAKRLLKAVVNQAGPHALIPEQIWDAKDIPKKFLFNGEPTLGAMPLVWAHAEFIKLVRSLHDKKVFDCPKITKERYLKNKHPSNMCLWRPNHKIKKISKDKDLRIEFFSPGKIHYELGNKKKKGLLKDTKLGLYYFDLNSKHLQNVTKVRFSFEPEGSRPKKRHVIQVV